MKQLQETLRSFNAEQKSFLFHHIADLIIERAIKDYRVALLMQTKSEIVDIEMFFLSSYFTFLSGYDGQILIDKLRYAYDNGYIKHRFVNKKS